MQSDTHLPLPTSGRTVTIRARATQQCRVCGGDGMVAHTGLVDQIFGAPGEWSMRRCTNRACRALWLDPAPIETDISLAYQRYYTHATELPSASMVRTLAAWIGRLDLTRRYGYASRKPALVTALGALTWLRPDLRALLDYQVMYLPARPGGRLLDVGCGDGEFLARMVGLGWSGEGVDFDPAAVAVARNRGLSVQVGSLIEQQYPEATFDAVTLSHVIEHVHQPEELLRECRRILKPGGLLSIVTPNAESLGHRRFGSHWRGLEPPRHLQIFTLPALAGLVTRVGLHVNVARTSFRGANFLFLMSQDLQQASGQPPLARKLWAKGLQIYEGLLLARGIPVGEELVIVAER